MSTGSGTVNASDIFGCGGSSSGSGSGGSDFPAALVGGSPGNVLSGIRQVNKRSDWPVSVSTSGSAYFKLGNGNFLRMPTSYYYKPDSVDDRYSNSISDAQGNLVSQTSHTSAQSSHIQAYLQSHHQRDNGDICVLARNGYSGSIYIAILIDGQDGSITQVSELNTSALGTTRPAHLSMAFDNSLGKFVVFRSQDLFAFSDALAINADGSGLSVISGYAANTRIADLDIPFIMGRHNGNTASLVAKIHTEFGVYAEISDFSKYSDFPAIVSTGSSTSEWVSVFWAQGVVHLMRASFLTYLYTGSTTRVDRADFERWIAEIVQINGGNLYA